MSGWGCRFGFVFTVVVFSQVAAGGMRTVLVDGDMDPTSGLPFHWFEEAVINDNGDIAFVGGRRGAASDSDTGIWSTAGGLHRVGLEGTDLEGHSDGSLFTHYGIQMDLLDDGELIGRAPVQRGGTNHLALWTSNGGPPYAIANEGLASELPSPALPGLWWECVH